MCVDDRLVGVLAVAGVGLTDVAGVTGASPPDLTPPALRSAWARAAPRTGRTASRSAGTGESAEVFGDGCSPGDAWVPIAQSLLAAPARPHVAAPAAFGRALPCTTAGDVLCRGTRRGAQRPWRAPVRRRGCRPRRAVAARRRVELTAQPRRPDRRNRRPPLSVLGGRAGVRLRQVAHRQRHPSRTLLHHCWSIVSRSLYVRKSCTTSGDPTPAATDERGGGAEAQSERRAGAASTQDAELTPSVGPVRQRPHSPLSVGRTKPASRPTVANPCQQLSFHVKRAASPVAGKRARRGTSQRPKPRPRQGRSDQGPTDPAHTPRATSGRPHEARAVRRKTSTSRRVR